MGVCMDTNYRLWNGTSSVVGWPQPTTAQPLWAYQRIAGLAKELTAAGFSSVRMPPSCKGAAGVFSDGYDLYDNYDIDETAFGNGEMLRQCVAALHAAGMQVYGDVVLHQYGGGTAEGVYATKRFPKHASCFVGAPPRVAVDPVPDPTGNFAFGDMASYVNSTPGGYMYFGAVDAAKWLTATVDFDGYRLDDAKGTYAPIQKAVIEESRVNYAVSEYFDGNPNAVGNYVNNIMGRSISVLDFATKFNVGNICNNNSRVWMGQLSDIGWCTKDAATAMTFAESADTDNSPGEQIIWNKMLAYAIILTFPGYPCVYYRDWATDPGCYGLKKPINNLIWIHEHLAQGDFVPRLDTHPQVFVHERMGYGDAPGCVCAFNNDQWNEYTVRVATRYAPNTRLHEYTGHYDTDVWTDSSGYITITLPKNNNGMSYLVFGLWITPPAFNLEPIRTLQDFFGAEDLSGGLKNGPVDFAAIYSAANMPVLPFFTPTRDGWTNEAEVTVSLIGPDGVELGSFDYDDQGTMIQTKAIMTKAAGRHVIRTIASGMPTPPPDFKIIVSYMGVS